MIDSNMTVIDMLSALEYFGTNKANGITGELYDSGEIPEDLNRCIFIAILKEVRFK